MIGPLRAKKILPAPIASHLRSIQSTTSPGSHYQMDKLTDSHVQIAMLALIELLDWYLSEVGEVNNPGTVSSAQGKKYPEQNMVPRYWYLMVLGLLLSLLYFFTVQVPSNHPIHKQDKVDVIQHSYMQSFSNRHFLTLQLLNQLTSTLGEDTLLIEQSLIKYRDIIAEYNIARGVYRQDLRLIFGDEVYLFEREIHNELFYANKNLECMIHKLGDTTTLSENAKKHLQTANASHQELNRLMDDIMNRIVEWPIPHTRSKQPLDPNLENPC